jgi:very-short-patch-repair endonuclease
MNGNADAAILSLARRQHGVVTRRQLIRAGLSDDVVSVRLARGQLTRLYRGVFQVGLFAPLHAREMAACLACGRGAFVGGHTAAVLWKVLPPDEAARPVDILLRYGIRIHPGINARRVASLRHNEVTKLDGIPITTPARTLLDLAATASPRELERALSAALALRLTTRTQLQELLKRVRGRRGTPALRAWLTEQVPALTRSEAEERLLALIRKARLPEPDLNVRVAGFEVDFYWPKQQLVAEVDGFALHAAADAFENDRSRDFVLASAGMRVVRITWKNLVKQPEMVIGRLAQALAVSASGHWLMDGPAQSRERHRSSRRVQRR